MVMIAENNDPSVPGDSPDGVNPANNKSESDDYAVNVDHPLLDWRDFRADLVIRKRVS